ncbi:hypothetical protein M0R72_10230 [Candidatus Pacearchaeota archaeon]|nr:hypothetical protein [Candidatus Pacearchaeota archaeon]
MATKSKKWTARDEWIFDALFAAEAKVHAIAKVYGYNVGAGLAIYTAHKAIKDALRRDSDENALQRSMICYDSNCDNGHMQDIASGLWRHLDEAEAVGTAIAGEVIAYADRICRGLKTAERSALSKK